MKLPPEQVKKIAIFRALQLGDMLCAIPAVRSLRMAYPDAEITLLGLPWAESFTKRFDKYFDKFIHFPGYPGLPEQDFDAENFFSFLQKMQDEQFDLLLQMQGNGTVVNELMFHFKAKNTAGFYNEESYVSSPFFMHYPNEGSEIKRHLALIEHLGIPSQGNNLEFPITKKDQEDFNNLLVYPGKKKYVCVHPGSRGRWRQWPPEYFAMLADHCAENGYVVVVTGTSNETDITREMIKCMHHPSIDLTAATNLGALAILVRDAHLLISNCTGVSHLAAATKTQSIIISMDGEPERWGPLNKKLHKIIDCRDQLRFEDVLVSTDQMLGERILKTA
jgi:ADP-heptose:LPS heptosyltransferase